MREHCQPVEQCRPTWLEIDLGAIAHNIRRLRARLCPGARYMAVVKADGYGHGAAEAASVALAEGAHALGVAMPEEGARLREAGLSAPILVLGGITQAGARAAVQYGLTQTVFDTEAVCLLAEAARRARRPVAVHIKVDSGMGRIGARDMDTLKALAGAIRDSAPWLRLQGVFTHFATADMEDEAYTMEQHARFLSLIGPLRKENHGLCVHAANSAALLRYPQTHHDMARAGIAQYVRPGLPGDSAEGFRQAMRWITRAVCVKEIPEGETVGYGRAFRARRITRVMTLPVGYADGYHRGIGGKGVALVHGRRVPVIGRVCMDQAMLDVTDVEGVAAGDEVVLLGGQGNEMISAGEMGGWCGMIDYETVLSPTARVPRVYLR